MLIYNKIDLPKIIDKRGNLSFIEEENHVPFAIKRAYWIYDVPGGQTRGGHAFIEQKEFVIALSGSFDVVLHDGEQEKRISLNRSYNGVFVSNGVWRSMDNFSTNAVALVLASTSFDEMDYIRDFNQFLKGDILRKTDSFTNAICVKNEILDYQRSIIGNCIKHDLKINHKDKGNITVAQYGDVLDFEIRRVYYLYDIPGGEERGGHAHKKLQQWLIAVSGSFDVVLDDGQNKKTVQLNRPYQALKIVPGIWRELNNFSSGSICLVLASEKYDESDYIRDYSQFKMLKHE